MKKFNVTGICVKEKHYMVDISEKIKKIMLLVDDGYYFTINRARQYGKTTTLYTLKKTLPDEYICISMSFEGVGQTMFENSKEFCQKFLLRISKTLENVDSAFAAQWLDERVTDFDLLGYHINDLCKNKKIVLLIDEVDKTSDNQIFLHFLGMLRNKYLEREAGEGYTFHSVILAGVYDIRNIKLKLIREGVYTEQGIIGTIYNSPWNIAANFNIDMSFNFMEIYKMINEYESDIQTGMDISMVTNKIHEYTNGYPFLVSRICQYIDEELNKNWSEAGIMEAINSILDEKNVLFDDLTKNLMNHKDLYDFLYEILIIGENKSFNYSSPMVELGHMYGYIKRGSSRNNVMIDNKIFEIFMSNYFIANDVNASHIDKEIVGALYLDIVKNNKFDMVLCLRKFAEHYKEIFSTNDAKFLEKNGRLLFISYLKPLINGVGFYHIESQFTDLRRMDIVVDFASDQFIIELKLWKGEIAREKAYEQLLDYMETKNAGKGYLLTFDFRKEVNKERKADWVQIGDRQIFDVVV